MNPTESRPDTLIALAVTALSKFSGRCAFGHKVGGAWVEVSHGEALRRVRAMTLGLQALGLERGDRVVILAENSLNWILADLAVLACGAADVPLYHSLTASQVEFIVRDAEPQLAFVSSREQLRKLEGLLMQPGSLRQVVLFEDGADDAPEPPVLSIGGLERRGAELERAHPGRFAELWPRVQAGDLATLIYTSGTTGEPKGVKLSHRNIVSNVLDTFVALKLAPRDEVALSYLPFSHIFERTNLYSFLQGGIPLYLAESIDKVAANLREVRPTMMTSVPRMFEKIYQRLLVAAARGSSLRSLLIHASLRAGRLHAERSHRGEPISWLLRLRYWLADLVLFRRWRQAVGGRIRYFVSGGAPLSTEIAWLFEAARMPILQGYGLTETSPVISVNPPDANRIGTVGPPIPNVQVRIADDGEILVRGPGVTSGYHRREEENQVAFRDGWFHTGDLGRLDEKGYLIVTDRKKDLIKTSGGKYVAPQPIEGAVLGSRFVSQVVVVGNERKFPSALVVPNPDMLRSYAALKRIEYADYAELLRHPQVLSLIERQVARQTEGLAQFERIKKVALLEQELTVEGGELTATLKVRRRDVERKYQKLIDSLYQDDRSPEVPVSPQGAAR